MDVDEKILLDIEHAVREADNPDKHINFFQTHPVFDKIKSKVDQLKKQIIKEQKEDSQPKWRVEKINDLQQKIEFNIQILEYLDFQFSSMQKFYDQFTKSVGAFLKGKELIQQTQDIQSHFKSQSDQIDTLTGFCISILENQSDTLIQTDRMKDFAAQLKNKSKAIMSYYDARINKIINE